MGLLKKGVDGGIPLTSTAAISYSGLLLKVDTTADQCALCGAGEYPDGFAYTDTVDPQTGTAAAGLVTMAPLQAGDIVDMRLPDTHSAITVGAAMETAASGCVIIKSGAGQIVGKALEAIDANTGGYVRVYVIPTYYASS